MKTPTSDKHNEKRQKCQTWLSRIKQFLLRGTRNREQLVQVLRISQQHGLLDAQALKMIEGVLQISDRQVRDIMVPHAKMTVVSESTPLPELLPIVIKSGHSRFPVIGNNNKGVTGLLLAKDLLKYNPLVHTDNFNIKDIIRPLVVIPESTRLNSLLEEFKHKHYHMAIVVDEYGNVSGLITIEDVLEQIVGDIEDEHDYDEEVFVQKQNPQQFTVKASMPIEDFNNYFNSELSTEKFDTVGGFIANRFGYLPKRGATISLASIQFKVLRAENRKIVLLEVTINKNQRKE